MIITKTEELEKFCTEIQSSSVIAVDTEFKRETTYYPDLCLIQIANETQFAIIDAIALKNLKPVNKLFQNKNIIKIIHSGSQDLEIFYQLFGELPKNLFDSQIAANAIGQRQQISFKDLVSYCLNIEMDKAETRSDWSKRPLSQKQIKYAEYDVTYLIRCYPIILKELEKLNRLGWLKGDFKQLESVEKHQVDKTSLWKRVKGHQNLKNSQLQQLNNLAIWREYIAIDKNQPRRRAVKDHYLLEAMQQPIEQIYGLSKLISQPLYQDKLQEIINDNVPCQIQNYQPVKLSAEEKVLFDTCLDFIEQQSNILNIDLKRYLGNSKIKQIIKKQLALSNPCLEQSTGNWLDHAINTPLAVFICEHKKIK